MIGNRRNLQNILPSGLMKPDDLNFLSFCDT